MLQIKVSINKKRNLRQFYNFIFEPKFVNQRGFVRSRVFNIFPQLWNDLETTQDKKQQKQILLDFINELYTKHRKDLFFIKKHIQWLFKDVGQQIFQWLKETMNYEYPYSKYSLYLSFLPVSTYNPQSANISILQEIGKTEFYISYVWIAIHEMSHAAFETKMLNIYTKKSKLDPIAHNYLKEILAPVVIRDKAFQWIAKLENHKYANTQQQLLNISDNWKFSNIVDYFENKYQLWKKEWKSFEEILEWFYDIFVKIQDQIIEKNKLFLQIHKWENMSSQWFINNLIKAWYVDSILL